MNLKEENSESRKVILDWWNYLHTRNGQKANLRRCTSPPETVFIPSSQILLSQLKKVEGENLSSDKICAIAGILSHVKENDTISFARKLSTKKSGSEQALVSDIRFRRILQYSNIANDELFYQKIIRVIHHIDFKANIIDLFSSLYFWGDSVKKRWAYDYYGTSSKSENDNEGLENTIAQGANNE